MPDCASLQKRYRWNKSSRLGKGLPLANRLSYLALSMFLFEATTLTDSGEIKLILGFPILTVGRLSRAYCSMCLSKGNLFGYDKRFLILNRVWIFADILLVLAGQQR